MDRDEALRYLGYDDQVVDEALQERMEDLFARCEEGAKPGWTYAVFDLAAEQEEACDTAPIRLAGANLELSGEDIHKHLTGARKVAVLAATVGLANEREFRELTARSGLDAAVFSAAGSALVETVADDCNAQIIEEARSQGLYPNWRYSPGYGDLPLSLQPAIIRLLSADRRLGITATASNLLIPSKSITAVIGFFDTPQQDRHGCADCAFAKFCTLKKKGSPCSP